MHVYPQPGRYSQVGGIGRLTSATAVIESRKAIYEYNRVDFGYLYGACVFRYFAAVSNTELIDPSKSRNHDNTFSRRLPVDGRRRFDEGSSNNRLD